MQAVGPSGTWQHSSLVFRLFNGAHTCHSLRILQCAGDQVPDALHWQLLVARIDSQLEADLSPSTQSSYHHSSSGIIGL